MSDCLFCKIIEGTIPSSQIYEDDSVFSFLDINPAAKGHLLVIPKRHTEILGDLQESEITALFNAIKKIEIAFSKAIDATGCNILMNYGKDAGQIIPHLHFHVIPRRKEDGVGISSWNPMKFSGEHLNEIAKEIAEMIS